MEGESRNGKRPRYESADTPETKRLREADIFIDILDDGADPYVDDLDDVIKSLEEQIAAPVPEPAPEEQEVDGPRQPDLGYLLEASDDELGLPPAADSSPAVDGVEVEVAGDGGFDRIWGFEDEISVRPYERFGFGIQTEFDVGVIFYGGLFDYSDVGFGPLDYEELTWRTESLPSI